ncbi:MAG: LamG-like jellyroll fold domain-containing protein [Bacteroidales bacterium]
MKKNTFIISLLMLLAVFAITFVSCDKEEEPVALTLVSCTAGDISINEATPPTNVVTTSIITATFSTNVDEATVDATTVKLKRASDNVDVELDLAVTGAVITITPVEDFFNGESYTLSLASGIKSTEGKPLTALQRSFTTEGTFVPSGMIAYWNFEDNANDQVGAWDPAVSDIIDITYTASRNTAAGKAATFNGSTSLIEIPNGDDLMNTTDFSIAFWVKTNSADKTNGHFVMGLGAWYGIQFEVFGAYDGAKFAIRYELADHSTAAEDMWFPANADLGWMGWTYAKSLTPEQMSALLKDTWLHVVYTYNATTKVGTLYYNGEKMKTFDFNLWPDGDAKKGVLGLKYDGDPLGNKLAFGFIQGRDNRIVTDTWADYADPANNHFKGQLDDVRIFHKVLTPTQVDLMYNSEN